MAGTCGYGEGLSGFINAGDFLTSCKVYWLASQEGLCSMELSKSARLAHSRAAASVESKMATMQHKIFFLRS